MLDLQRADVWKRISAFIFDGIILSVVTVGFAFLLSVIVGYDAASDRLDTIYARYESEYGVVFDITEDEYNAMTDDGREAYDRAFEAMNADGEAGGAYSLLVELTLCIASLSIFLGYAIVDFAFPLAFKNGQTPGKKIFGVALMRVDGVRLTPIQLFVRTLLGKYTIETMIPVLLIIMIYFNIIGITGVIVIAGIALTQLLLFLLTRNRSAIHDLLAGTVAVDLLTQKIFDTPQDLIEYKKRMAAEAAEKAEYR